MFIDSCQASFWWWRGVSFLHRMNADVAIMHFFCRTKTQCPKWEFQGWRSFSCCCCCSCCWSCFNASWFNWMMINSHECWGKTGVLPCWQDGPDPLLTRWPRLSLWWLLFYVCIITTYSILIVSTCFFIDPNSIDMFNEWWWSWWWYWWFWGTQSWESDSQCLGERWIYQNPAEKSHGEMHCLSPSFEQKSRPNNCYKCFPGNTKISPCPSVGHFKKIIVQFSWGGYC